MLYRHGGVRPVQFDLSAEGDCPRLRVSEALFVVKQRWAEQYSTGVQPSLFQYLDLDTKLKPGRMVASPAVKVPVIDRWVKHALREAKRSGQRNRSR